MILELGLYYTLALYGGPRLIAFPRKPLPIIGVL